MDRVVSQVISFFAQDHGVLDLFFGLPNLKYISFIRCLQKLTAEVIQHRLFYLQFFFLLSF